VDVGHVIRRLRQDKGWTLGQLSVYSGIGKSYLSRIERGKHPNLSAKKVGKIANALNVSPNYIYEQAGWYESKQNPTLPPEVLELAEVVEAYPEGPAKTQATQMIIDVAVILQTLRERMEDAARAKAQKGTEP